MNTSTFNCCPPSVAWHARAWHIGTLNLALLCFLIHHLGFTLPATALDDVRITEFMASNSRTLQDEDHEFSDWIEIFNAGSNTVNLLNWGLTDTAGQPFRWRFPATNINAGAFMIVFASSKDRKVPGANLHTSFRLSTSGGYLALVRPDGTIATQFNPYPRQAPDVSYGFGDLSTNQTVIASNTLVRAQVPIDGSDGTNWTTVGFDDIEWTSGPNGVGYFAPPYVKTDIGLAMSNVNASAYIRLPFTITEPTNVTLLTLRLRYDDGFVAFINGAEVLSANAPNELSFDSSATNAHAAGTVEQFQLGTGLLQAGTNLLAIQGLNVAANDTDFLIYAELVAAVRVSSSQPLYFTRPTTNGPNSGGVAILGPAILETTHSPNVPTDADDLLITAQVVPTFFPITNVVMRYRIMFGNEVEVRMFDDGAHNDGLPGDSVYGATIPASASTNSQMIRWFFRAQDSQSNTSRWPLFTDPGSTPEYLGTMVDYAVVSKLPVVHLFAPATVLQPGPTTGQTGADSQGGGRVALFHDGEFYDNVYMSLRGNTTAGYNKKSHRVEFNNEHGFRHTLASAGALPGGDATRIRHTSFVADYPDPAYMRQGLCYWLGNLIGSPSPFYYPVRLQLNGQFYQLANHNDVQDEEQLIRLGYDPNGALYNAAGRCNEPPQSTGGFEKKTRRWDNIAGSSPARGQDYVTMATGISETNTQRRLNLYDLFDIPNAISYMVVARWAHENDDVWANMSLYHDNDGDNLWRIIGFDMNLSWGAIFYEGGLGPLIGDGLPGNVIGTFDVHKAHPLYGSSQNTARSGPDGGAAYNRVYDVFFLVPEVREMYLRRLRTMMDTYVKPPGTHPLALPMENQVRELGNLIAEEATRDRAFWGWPGKSGQCNFDPGINITNGVNGILNQFIAQRRLHFYGKHSITNTALPIGIHTNENAGIPLSQPTNAIVAVGDVEYNPASKNQLHEYVCITNPNPFAVDISGWKLGGGVDFTFKPGTVIPSNRVLYVSPDVRAFKARTTGPRGGQGLFVVGPYQGQLSARGEPLTINDDTGRLVYTNSTPYTGTPSLAQRFLRITEIMYNPSPAPAISSDAQAFEYLELKNVSTNVTLDLTDVHFGLGINFTFTGSAVTSLAAGARVLIVKSNAQFTARYGGGLNVAGQYSGSLDNSGDRIKLLDASNEEILDFEYRDSWYPITDGAGFSLVVVDENAEPDAWSSKSNWRPSGSENGGPGQADPPPPVVAPILVNEVLTHTDTPPPPDTVELLNPTTNEVNIGGWFLTDSFNTPKRYRIPANTMIAAGGYLTFDEGVLGFAFSSLGEEVYLFSGDANTNLTGYVHGYQFDAAENGVSFGRYTNSQTNVVFVAQSNLTLSGANAYPRVGPVIISEIMFHPPDLSDGSDNSDDEYIELKNITLAPVQLFLPAFPTNTWRLRGGVDFDFPTNIVLPANGSLLVVNFQATNAAKLAAFRTKYGVSPSIPAFGPYDGKLDNSSDTVKLEKPDTPVAGLTPYVLVERVEYFDKAPWPSGADGTGAALQRIHANEYADDPINWAAVTPAIGSGFGGGTGPTINSQPAGFQAVAFSDYALSVSASGTAPLRYQWRFNGSALEEATNATLNLPGIQPPQAGAYDVAVFNSAGSVLSAVAMVTVGYPAYISSHPSNAAPRLGSNATFSVTATGTGVLRYQWRFNNLEIGGATNSSFTITNAQLANQGLYTVVITDDVGAITSAPASLVVLINPVITQQPLGATVAAGSTVSFSVAATGNPLPFGFRWRRIGIVHSFFQTNQTSMTLTLNSVSNGNAGNWTVIVTNQANTSGVISTNAFLTVVTPPTNQTVPLGGTATFTVSATNVANSFPGYQWRFNGQDISGATTNYYSVTNVQPSHVGTYSVVVTVTNVPAPPPATFSATLALLVAGPTLSNPEVLSNGVFRAQLEGTLNQMYAIESSRDLTNWGVLTNLTFSGSPAYFVDPGRTNATGATNRFYRARETQ